MRIKSTVPIYGVSLALLTDLYQLTMAYGYWKDKKMRDMEVTFNLYFRKSPFGGGYAIAAGMQYAIDYLQLLRFQPDDIDYLRTLTGNDNKPLFCEGFLNYLGKMRFDCDVWGIPEGTAVFPNEPLLRITGPLIMAQLIETPLLNMLNFQTLIASKSARVCNAAGGDPVLEFALRRAQGIDGGLSASRAAYIGGCVATSNVLAGKLFGIPVKGTHAHSWVMSYGDEKEAFRAYADAMPANGLFLVDTYDTLKSGVPNAIEQLKRLRAAGYKPVGIRLDSGDLAWLSAQAYEQLKAAGLEDLLIVASNDLDEYTIEDIKRQPVILDDDSDGFVPSRVNCWGVGTQLGTGGDQAALGGVYKIVEVKLPNGTWEKRIKLSEEVGKVTIPGRHQVRRYLSAKGRMMGDQIYEVGIGVTSQTIIDPRESRKRKRIENAASYTDLLVPIFECGKLVYESPSLAEIRDRTREQLASLNPGVLRLKNSHTYKVGLEPQLAALRQQMIEGEIEEVAA